MKKSIGNFVEQADGRDGNRRRGSRHAFFKRHKSRTERHRARRDPEVQPAYGRYQGYES